MHRTIHPVRRSAVILAGLAGALLAFGARLPLIGALIAVTLDRARAARRPVTRAAT